MQTLRVLNSGSSKIYFPWIFTLDYSLPLAFSKGIFASTKETASKDKGHLQGFFPGKTRDNDGISPTILEEGRY